MKNLELENEKLMKNFDSLQHDTKSAITEYELNFLRIYLELRKKWEGLGKVGKWRKKRWFKN